MGYVSIEQKHFMPSGIKGKKTPAVPDTTSVFY